MTSSTIVIAISKVKAALTKCKLMEGLEPLKQSVEALAANPKALTVQVELCDQPKEYLKVLLDEDLSPNQRKLVAMFAIGTQEKIFDDTPITSPKDLSNAITVITDKASTAPNAEIMVNGRWYPVIIASEFSSQEFFGQMCSLTTTYNFCDIADQKSWRIGSSFFVDEKGNERSYTLRELLEFLEIRPLQQDMAAFYKKCRRADYINRTHGTMFSVTNNVLIKYSYQWYSKLDSIQFGSPIVPRKVVTENELERDQHGGYYGNNGKATALPFVRCFSLDMKKYVYADVDDVEEYKFDTRAIERLVLPENLSGILKTVFTAEGVYFGDIIKGKSGGMIILANGPTGVGKTLTAEVFSEFTKRPLYVMEMGELGTDLASVEQNLQKIFIRASRWKAVLLFDEADVFMATRNENLERSAIVGVFLRLLDYYDGLLFLTTNRADVIDLRAGLR